MYHLLRWRGKNPKETERKEDEKDVPSPSVEAGEETGDQHGVPYLYLQRCAVPLLSKPPGARAVCLSVRPSVRRAGCLGGRALRHLNGCTAAHLSGNFPGAVAKQICCSRLESCKHMGTNNRLSE